MRKQFYNYLSTLFRLNPRICILLGDIGVHSFKSSFEFDPTRIYNMGIMEQTMIGVAGGLASKGLIPFVHSIAPFVTERCYEQLKLDLGYEKKNVFIVSVGNSYDYAGLGVTHHCTNDLKIVSAIPNFKVYCPGNTQDVIGIISKTININQPKYIRLSEFENNLSEHFITNGNFDILNLNANGVIVVVGNAIKDFSKLLSSDIRSTILYTYNISDLDMSKFRYLIRQHKLKTNITIVEPCSDSGLISKIVLNIENITKINSISVPNQFIDKYGSKEQIDKYLGLDDDSIIEKLKRIYNEH